MFRSRCKKSLPLLQQLALRQRSENGRVPFADREATLDHIEKCAECRKRARQYEVLFGYLRDLKKSQAPRDFREDFLARLSRDRRPALGFARRRRLKILYAGLSVAACTVMIFALTTASNDGGKIEQVSEELQSEPESAVAHEESDVVPPVEEPPVPEPIESTPMLDPGESEFMSSSIPTQSR